MSIILKRPMFRQGGSSAYGVGITSNLEPRKKYQGGTNPSLEDQMKIIKALGQQFGPQPGDTIKNLAFGFGASGADVPAGGLQTWGQAIGKATQMARGLQSQKEATQAAFETQGMLKLLGNIDKETLTAVDKNARLFARTNWMNFPGKDEEEKRKNAYAKKIAELLSIERKSETPQDTIRNIQKGKQSSYGESNIYPGSETEHKINTGEIKLPPITITNNKGEKVQVHPQHKGWIKKDDVILQGDGQIAIIDTKKPGNTPATIARAYQANQYYIHPEGYVYQYQGNGTFRRVYP